MASEEGWFNIGAAYCYLHAQGESCWAHELQLTPFSRKPFV